MRYTYIDDISSTFNASLDKLEKHLLWCPQGDKDIVERIYKFGEALLTLKEKEHLDGNLEGSLGERLHEFREIILGKIELKYFPKVGDGPHPERIRKVRGKIRSVLLDAENPPTAEMRKEYDEDFDKLHFATQLYSYPGQYIRENPTNDRIAETILKFEEDVFGEYQIKGKRKSIVTFCKPINMYDYLDQFTDKPKPALSAVTSQIEDAIKGVLEDNNQLYKKENSKNSV